MKGEIINQLLEISTIHNGIDGILGFRERERGKGEIFIIEEPKEIRVCGEGERD